MVTDVQIGALGAARALSALVASEAVEAQRSTSVTASVVEALTAANLYQLMIPTSFGGGGADVWTMVEVIEELSRADPSTGWSYMANVIAGASYAGHFDESTGRAVFGTEPAAIVAGMIAPTGTATPVDGGYRITGTVSFASGSGYATWICGGAVLDADHGPRVVAYLLPKEQTECRYNWDVEGLVATGSYDYAVHDQFVPTELTFFNDEDLALVPPSERRAQPDLYIDRFALGVSGHVGVALGTAKRAMEEIVLIADMGKQRRNAPPIKDQQLFQYGFGIADAKLRSARAYVKEAIAAASETLQAGGLTSDAEAHRIYQAGHWLVQCAVDVVEFAYYWSGSQGLRVPHPLGRIMRDMVMAQNQHLFVDTTLLTTSAPSLLASYRADTN